MTEDLSELIGRMNAWMTGYMRSFHTEDAEVMQGIAIKEKHTWLVRDIAVALAEHLKLTAHDRQLAEIMGLFHDVGRFRQYTLYQTFNDAQSEDHADLGLKVLAELPFMKELAPEDEELVRFAIGNHNKKLIAPTDDKRKLFFARLLRDADKLDIYRVLAPFLDGDGLKNAPKFMKSERTRLVNPDFVEDFAAGRQVDYYRMKTDGDRIVVRLMWVYDINFGWTLRKIVERGYLERIVASLPSASEQPELQAGFARLYEYIEKKTAAPDVADIY